MIFVTSFMMTTMLMTNFDDALTTYSQYHSQMTIENDYTFLESHKVQPSAHHTICHGHE